MRTRKEYLNKECTHSEYYSQFIDNQILAVVKGSFGGRKACFPSEDDIPLREWDNLFWQVNRNDIKKRLKEAGDSLSMAGSVCILKEAYRQLFRK